MLKDVEAGIFGTCDPFREVSLDRFGARTWRRRGKGPVFCVVVPNDSCQTKDILRNGANPIVDVAIGRAPESEVTIVNIYVS